MFELAVLDIVVFELAVLDIVVFELAVLDIAVLDIVVFELVVLDIVALLGSSSCKESGASAVAHPSANSGKQITLENFNRLVWLV